ncbi:MAG: hypothetical protein K6B52_00630 [Clostridiales bacterium]|nr:hypothetical protein [Clostridiales bacterium]
MQNDNTGNSNEVYFFMDAPQVKQVDNEELRKEHGEKDSLEYDELYCINETSWD